MAELITAEYAWDDPTLVAIDQDGVEELRALLLGHRVEKIADDHLRLDDGTVIRIVPNVGGCACSAGDYELTDLNECDNIITSVEVVNEVDNAEDEWGDRTYRVFVVAEDKRINLFAVSGSDGNGYYGTGYELFVRKPVSAA